MGGYTGIRLTARWQTTLDERILERLRDAGETNVPLLCAHLDAPSGIVRDRLRMLAQVELVLVDRITHGYDWYEISYWGRRYLEGEYDVHLHPRPNPITGYRIRS